ncbi:MAG: DUF72 domain-containing protein [Cyanobacteria bacterium J06554_11]
MVSHSEQQANVDSLNFRIGCAVWAFKDWVGRFYPAKSQATNFLKLYGERMLTVEGNTTFYSVPSPQMVQRWAEQTPPDFRFCPKLPRTVTHDGLLMPHLPEALSFLQLMQGLGRRLGPVMVQLPPSYSPANFRDLAAFLEAWPRRIAPIAVEVRHLDWFKPVNAQRLKQRLTQLGVGRVLLDSRTMYAHEQHGEVDPQLHSNRRKPKVPLQPGVTADFAIVRYISHPKVLRNQDYLSEWVAWVGDWLAAGKQVYFFVHCPMEVESPSVAEYFQERLEAENVPVPPLPWMHLAKPSEQLSLF